MMCIVFQSWKWSVWILGSSCWCKSVQTHMDNEHKPQGMKCTRDSNLLQVKGGETIYNNIKQLHLQYWGKQFNFTVFSVLIIPILYLYVYKSGKSITMIIYKYYEQKIKKLDKLKYSHNNCICTAIILSIIFSSHTCRGGCHRLS